MEISQAKLIWDFEFNLQKITTSIKPDLILEEKQKKTFRICHIPCPQENNIEKKRLKKKTNCRKFSFEIRKRKPVFKIRVMLLVIRVFGGWMKEVLKELENMLEKDFCEKIVAEMEKTILMDRETINGKVLP